MGNVNGTYDLRLQGHFSFIKGIGIHLQTMNSIALRSNAFNHEECDYTSSQSNNVHQKECFLKTLIRKGHYKCKLFLQELARSGYKDEVDVCLTEHNDDDNVNDQLNNVTSEKIEQNLEYIASNLEISIVLDMLFERQIITIDEHDEVQRKSTKPEKRRTLLSLLLRRPNTNWLLGFIRVLRNTGHIILLERLRQHANNGQELTELPFVRLGHTRPGPGPSDFIARLSTPREEREDINIQMFQQVIQEALDSGVIEIWEGSIYLYLSTFFPDTILTILNGKGDAKLITFLQRLFSENRYLLHQFSKDTIVQFELEEKPEDIFIDTFYGRWKSQIPTNKDTFCSGCWQATLRANYKTVLDEIEDDIIQDTLTRLEKLEKPNDQLHSSRCLLKNKTRSEKAFTFLQYVLGNEHVLYEFSKAFRYHSQVELEHVKCRNCSLPEGVFILSKPRKIVFHFTISMNDFDQIKITNIEKELMTPSVALRPLVDRIDIAPRKQLMKSESLKEFRVQIEIKPLKRELTAPSIVFKLLDDRTDITARKPLEHMSLEELPDITTDKYRIVVIETEDTEFLRELQLSTGHQLHVFRTPHFRFFPKEARRRLKDCISSASPGPHAFLFATELDDPYPLKICLNEFGEYLGSDFMQFLIPIFTTNSKHDEHSLQEAQAIVDIYFAQLPSFRPNKNRFIVFNNNTTGREKAVQIGELTKLIARMQIENMQKYYTNKSFEKSKKAVQK